MGEMCPDVQTAAFIERAVDEARRDTEEETEQVMVAPLDES
jgi:hypothetical protein